MNDNHETREEYRKKMEQRIHDKVAQDQKQNHESKMSKFKLPKFKSSNNNKPRRTSSNINPNTPEVHHYRTPRWVKNIIWALVILVLLGGGYEYHKINSAANNIFGSGDGKISKKLQKGEPVSVLTMGTDVGALDRGNTGGNTDSLELFTINPKTKRITMTSIPRDTLVRVPTKEGPTYVKINAAYSIGGPKKTVKAVSELLDVPIDYYAVINMGVLKKVVNTVGGVTVDNPFAFTYEGHHFKKGKQHLNGELALKYSRMRYSDPNNDYGRQKRQQQIIESVIQKFKKSGSIGTANNILDAVKDGVKTNIPVDDIATLYGNYHAAMDNVTTYHFQGQDATIEGVSFQIASPKEINRISKLIRKQLGLKPKKVVNHETRMYKSQPSYNGVTNTDFILPGGASYNDPGSGNGSDYVIGGKTSIKSSSQKQSSIYSNSARTYGEIRSSQVTTQVPQTERRTQSTVRSEYQTTRTPTTGRVSENTTARTVQEPTTTRE
ncbi:MULTISPECIES: LCP family protein [Limosilactobacillus]|uniref:LCP family protein n=1 Tax=Limosilactobacillus TaxID=2742598 RepID=UPI0022A9BB26|nr:MULTISPECIES: LCP family protein [Limosilactobacillus]MCI6852686.1 LCP family protein [Limosilactobacillus vaginalis]MCZ2466019.1 LCP family protein [Limosilactobacillus vaginalis]MDY4864447.1 LCP family protein [Limosilactobacillus sp.]